MTPNKHYFKTPHLLVVQWAIDSSIHVALMQDQMFIDFWSQM